MTNEEAIRHLRYCKRWNDTPMEEAIDLAINALKLSDGVESITFEAETDIIYRHIVIDSIKNDVLAVTPTQIDTKIDCIKCVEKVPSIQPEIIMCKDCFWYRHNLHGETWCDHPHGLIGWVKDTDYCSKSERRTDG